MKNYTSVEHQVRAARTSAFQERDIPTGTPLIYIEGHPPWGEGLSGLIVRTEVLENTYGKHDNS